jgi:hypothetical protein
MTWLWGILCLMTHGWRVDSNQSVLLQWLDYEDLSVWWSMGDEWTVISVLLQWLDYEDLSVWWPMGDEWTVIRVSYYNDLTMRISLSDDPWVTSGQ